MALFVPRQQRQLYPTFLSSSPSGYMPLLSAYLEMMTKFSWRSAVIIVDVGPNPYYIDFGNALLKTFTLQEGYQIDHLKFNSSHQASDYELLLSRAQRTSRGKSLQNFSISSSYVRVKINARYSWAMNTSGPCQFCTTLMYLAKPSVQSMTKQWFLYSTMMSI